MMKLSHALLGLGAVYLLTRTASSASAAPDALINVRDLDPVYNPTGASTVPASQLSDFNRQAQGLALQGQYNALRIQYAVPLENLINSLNSKISSGGYAGATLSQMKATRADVQEQLNKVWTDLLTPLRTQYQSYLR